MAVTKPLYPIAKEDLEAIVLKVESGMPIGQALEEKSRSLKVSSTTLRNRIYGHDDLSRRLDIAKHTQAAARAQANIATLAAARERDNAEIVVETITEKKEAIAEKESDKQTKPAKVEAPSTPQPTGWETIAGALRDIRPNTVSDKIEELLLDRKIEEKLKRERPHAEPVPAKPNFSWAGFAMIGGLIVGLALFFWFLTKKNESSRIIEVEKIEKPVNELDEAWSHVNRTKRGLGLQ